MNISPERPFWPRSDCSHTDIRTCQSDSPWVPIWLVLLLHFLMLVSTWHIINIFTNPVHFSHSVIFLIVDFCSSVHYFHSLIYSWISFAEICNTLYHPNIFNFGKMNEIREVESHPRVVFCCPSSLSRPTNLNK